MFDFLKTIFGSPQLLRVPGVRWGIIRILFWPPSRARYERIQREMNF